MKKKILIVEDEPQQRDALKIKFEEGGYTVLLAENGKMGLQVALEQEPDIIVTDILMPVMDGIQMIEMIRSDVWGKTVPVIVLTNLGDREGSMLDQKTHDFLVKSDVTLEQIFEKVDQQLNK